MDWATSRSKQAVQNDCEEDRLAFMVWMVAMLVGDVMASLPMYWKFWRQSSTTSKSTGEMLTRHHWAMKALSRFLRTAMKHMRRSRVSVASSSTTSLPVSE